MTIRITLCALALTFAAVSSSIAGPPSGASGVADVKTEGSPTDSRAARRARSRDFRQAMGFLNDLDRQIERLLRDLPEIGVDEALEESTVLPRKSDLFSPRPFDSRPRQPSARRLNPEEI